MATKVTTVIVNQTKYVLIINVGTHCLASLKAGGEYKIQVDVNWTFQEFVLEVDSTDHNTMKLSVNSDDCCDYRRITVTDVNGKLMLFENLGNRVPMQILKQRWRRLPQDGVQV